LLKENMRKLLIIFRKWYATLCSPMKPKPGDKYTSPYLDKLTYEGATEDFDAYTVHNCAYYSLEKMSQDRYDPIRNTERFKKICDTLEKSAK
jgi:hypothetical protein